MGLFIASSATFLPCSQSLNLELSNSNVLFSYHHEGSQENTER